MKPGSLPLWQYFFYVNTGLGWVYGTAGLTGDLLIVLLIVIVICSLPCVRNKGFFEVWINTLAIGTAVIIIIFALLLQIGLLLDPQSLHSMVYLTDSPWYTLLEVVLSPCTGLHH